MYQQEFYFLQSICNLKGSTGSGKTETLILAFQRLSEGLNCPLASPVPGAWDVSGNKTPRNAFEGRLGAL